MAPKHPVIHFEMPYQDAARVAEFYNKAFGWPMQQLGEDFGDYVVAETTETECGQPVTPGAINGGFFPCKPDWPQQHPNAVIHAADLDAAIVAVKEAGGTVLGEPMSIPGVGRYVSFNDTEGNRVSLLEPDMSGSEAG